VNSPRFFENEIRLLDCYYWWCRGGSFAWDEQVVLELRDRLRQLSYLYDEVVRLETAVLTDHGQPAPGPGADVYIVLFMPGGPPPNLDIKPFDDADRLRLAVETFYFVAHRMMDLSEHRDALPRLAPIEASGVRRVRNNLIAHAHLKSGSLASNFSVASAPGGTRLRTARRAGDPSGYQDEGIHHNAQEFREAVHTHLMKALNTEGEE
jgi:hypothetical protein